MGFDYFYTKDSERFQFFMLPKILVTGEQFKTISSDAKILYACLFNRISLSEKNDWRDKEGRIYIIFTIEEIMQTINRSRPTAVKALNELDESTGGIGLIERKRLGFGKPNIIYVKDFASYKEEKLENQTTRSKESELQEVKIIYFKKLIKLTLLILIISILSISRLILAKGKKVLELFKMFFYLRVN